MTRVIQITLLIFLSTFSWAQQDAPLNGSVKGKIVDEATRQPLVGADVF